MTSRQNPYAPPQAPVADTPEPGSAEKPRQVIVAVRLLWAMLIIGMPGFALQMPALFEYSLLAGLLSIAQVVVQVVAMYIVFTEPGRGWYRR